MTSHARFTCYKPSFSAQTNAQMNYPKTDYYGKKLLTGRFQNARFQISFKELQRVWKDKSKWTQTMKNTFSHINVKLKSMFEMCMKRVMNYRHSIKDSELLLDALRKSHPDIIVDYITVNHYGLELKKLEFLDNRSQREKNNSKFTVPYTNGPTVTLEKHVKNLGEQLECCMKSHWVYRLHQQQYETYGPKVLWALLFNEIPDDTINENNIDEEQTTYIHFMTIEEKQQFNEMIRNNVSTEECLSYILEHAYFIINAEENGQKQIINHVLDYIKKYDILRLEHSIEEVNESSVYNSNHEFTTLTRVLIESMKAGELTIQNFITDKRDPDEHLYGNFKNYYGLTSVNSTFDIKKDKTVTLKDYGFDTNYSFNMFDIRLSSYTKQHNVPLMMENENVINEMLTDRYYVPDSQVILRKYDRPSLLRTGYIANYGKIVNNWKSCYSVSSESFIAILNAACVFEGILVNIVDDSIIIKSFNDFGEQTTEIPLDLAYHEENKNNIVIQMAKKFIKLYRGIVGGEHYNCNADNNVIKIVTEPIKIWENKSIEAPKEYRPLAVDKINMQYDKIDLSTRDVTITIKDRKHNFNYKFESYDSKLDPDKKHIVMFNSVKLLFEIVGQNITFDSGIIHFMINCMIDSGLDPNIFIPYQRYIIRDNICVENSEYIGEHNLSSSFVEFLKQHKYVDYRVIYTILHDFNTDYAYVFLKLVEEILEKDDPERVIRFNKYRNKQNGNKKTTKKGKAKKAKR